MIPKRHSTRAARGAPAASLGAADAARPAPGPRPATYELIERITSLQLKMVPLEALADGIVPPLLDAFAAPAGGLLLYHAEDGSLRLLASRGLSAQGREHLALLRPGAAGGWDIPLHGLMNRKAYIIERPHEHPFVPELVERDETRPPANLACIPLYRGQLPVGVILVIADRRPVTNPEVMTHVLVYDVLALALDAGLRSRGEPPAPLPPDFAVALTCEEWIDPADTTRSLERELALVTSERIELAERVGVLEAAHAEARGLLAAQKTLHRDLLEAERAEAARRIADLEQAMAEAVARARHEVEQTRAAERAGVDEQLALERNAAATTIRELESTLEDREAAFATALQKLQAALQEREVALAERDARLAELAGERDRVRHAAGEAGETVRELHAEIERLKAAQAAAEADRARTFAETEAALERQLAAVTLEHRRVLERVETDYGGAVAAARATEERAAALARDLAAVREEVTGLRAERAQVLTALDAPGIEPAAAVRMLHERVAVLEGQVRAQEAARAELERAHAASLAAAEERLSAQRRELHELHAVHERERDDLATAHRNALDEVRAVARRAIEEAEAVQRAQVAEVQAEAQRKIELERFDAQQRLDALRIESRDALHAARAAQGEAAGRAGAAEARVAVLAEELDAVRAEAERLAEERAQVLAAVDDPHAEPATVIRALRDQVAALEGQVAMLGADRSALERQRAAAAQAAEARLAEVMAGAEARVRAVEATAQASLDEVRRTSETTLAELRAAVAERDALLGARELALREAADDRDRARRAAVEAGDALRRSQAEQERVRVELGSSETAAREARAQAAASAAHLLELERELGAARDELGRLHEERARVLAAVDDGSEPAAVIRALREQTVALETQVRALADERAAAAERAASERAGLEAKLGALHQELAGLDAERGRQTGRIAALERDLIRSEEMLASARRQLDAAVERVRAHAGAAPAAVGPPPAAEPPLAPAAVAVAPSPPRVEVLAPPPAPVVEAGAHRILEGDPLVRERVAAALADAVPGDAAPALFVANLMSVLPDRLGELDRVTDAGGVVVTYAAASGRSRILGGLRCFTASPAAEVLAPAVAKLGPQRRLISLSDDVDGLIPLKAVLTKAGHSISMACDPKQALDLLGMLTPDAVLVDLRHAPESAATFLDALALENGRTPAFLVCGEDDPAGVLRRAIEPLLRPAPLDAAQLAMVCQTILAPPQPEKRDPTKVVRPMERKPTPAARKPLSRRILTKRR